MTTSATTVRRGLYGMFAGGLLAFGSAAIIAPVAGAQPAPVPAPSFDCTASAVAGTVSTAAASEGAYLTANPQTNEALTSISAKPQEEAQSAYAAVLRPESAGRGSAAGYPRPGQRTEERVRCDGVADAGLAGGVEHLRFTGYGSGPRRDGAWRDGARRSDRRDPDGARNADELTAVIA